MDDDQTGWQRFRRIKFSKKSFARGMKKVEGVTVRHAHKFIISRWDNIRDVRRHIILWLVGVGLLIAVVGLQIAWFQQSYMTIGAVSGGVYAEAVKGSVDTLNPLYATSGAEIAASKLLFSSLFDYDATGHLRDDLATSLTMAPNGLDYTITLRPGVTWHDGQPVTVDDIIFTTGLMKDPTTRAVASLRQAWKDITVVPLGESAVKFTLPSPNAAFPQALTFAILPQHILKNIQPQQLRENTFSTAPVGTGPFQIKRVQLVNASEGRKIVHMSAFAKYYKGAPKLNRFQLHVYGSVAAIMTALRTGEVNAAADIDATDAANVDAAHYLTLAKPVNSGVYALLNTTAPQLQDKIVRQALQAATDTAEVRKKIGGGHHPMDLPFADGQLVGASVPMAPPYDQTKAAALFEQAGWKLVNGIRTKDGKPLKLHLVTVVDDTYEKALKELSDEWRKVGVATDVTVIDPNDLTQDFTQTLKVRDYDVLINQLIIGADPDVYAYWHSSQATELGKNYSNYSNSISDTALSGALNKSDPAYRDTRYKAFAKQWLEDAPAIGLYQSNMYYVHSKSSQTITDDEKIISPTDRYSGVIYWTVDQGRVYTTP